MSGIRETVLNNDDATHTLRGSKAKRGLDRLTVGSQGSSGDRGAHAWDPHEEPLRLTGLRLIAQEAHFAALVKLHREFLESKGPSLQDHLAFLMPLHSRVGTYGVIRHKVIQYSNPRVVVGQVVIVLSGDLPHLRG